MPDTGNAGDRRPAYGKAVGRAAPWWGSGPAMRLSSSLCWRKKAENYLAIRIPGKTSKAVMHVMAALRAEYGQHFPQVLKTITVDSGSEFAGFPQTEAWGGKVFLAHPYAAWERAQNEQHNGLFRSFVPKDAPLSCLPMRTSLQLLTS